MSAHSEERLPFLDDLTDDAQLISTVVRRPVAGRENIRKVVAAVGSLYQSQTPTFLGAIGKRTLLQYDAVLQSGQALKGVAVIERNDDGGVVSVSVTFSPFESTLALATSLAGLMKGEFEQGIFI
jgi:hypothetical protein